MASLLVDKRAKLSIATRMWLLFFVVFFLGFFFCWALEPVPSVWIASSYKEAFTDYYQQRYPQAKAKFTKLVAIKNLKEEATFNYYLALCELKMGAFENSIKFLAEALKFDYMPALGDEYARELAHATIPARRLVELLQVILDEQKIPTNNVAAFINLVASKSGDPDTRLMVKKLLPSSEPAG